MASTIALITDFSNSDFYTGIVKGVICSINPEVKIVDLTHNIASFDITTVPFFLRRVFFYFPLDTIFIVVVDPGVGGNRSILLLKAYGRYFIGPNNGIFSFIEEKHLKFAIQIAKKSYIAGSLSSTFHARDIMAPIAAHISLMNDIKRQQQILCADNYISNFFTTIGKPTTYTEIKKIPLPQPIIKKRKIVGKVIYIDKFGNIITNIDKDTLLKVSNSKRIKIHYKDYIISGLVSSYYSGGKGSRATTGFSKPFALINSFDLLEIALWEASAQQELQACAGDEVIVMW